MLFPPDCSTVIWGALRLTAGTPRLAVSAPSLISGTPRCSQVHLKATVMVKSTVGFDHRGILVRQLSDTPRGSQWHNYILLMQRYSDPPCSNISMVNESSQGLFSLLTLCIKLSKWLHQQNVYRSGGSTLSSQALRATWPLLQSTSRYSQTPLEQSKELPDSARAFSGALRFDLLNTYILELLRPLRRSAGDFKTSWDCCTALREALCRILTAVVVT